MRIMNYNDFVRLFVQRKKQELVDPNFIGVGEIVLHKHALIHFTPKGDELGPSNSEAFISNFPGEVFVDFPTDFTPILGSVRIAPFEMRKAIQQYRASHYSYQWTRDINTVYQKADVLVVRNHALAEKPAVYRTSLFAGYEKYYNRMAMVIKSINAGLDYKTERKQYVRLELPVNIPSFNELMVDYEKYIRGFKDGLPVPTQQTVRLTKAENSYWLLDLLAFLYGEYDCSLFSKLDPQVLENTHWIFTANSKALVINVLTLKTWLEELDLPVKEKKEGAKEEPYEPSPKRKNVTRRVYLALMNLANDLVPEQELKDGQGADTAQEGRGSVAEGTTGTQEGKGRSPVPGEEGSVHGENEPPDTDTPHRSLADVLKDRPQDSGTVDETGGPTTDGANSEDPEEWSAEVDDKLLEVEHTKTEISVNKVMFPTPESGIKLALDELARDGTLTVAEQNFFMRSGESYKQIELENGQSLEEFMVIDSAAINNLDGKIEGNFLTVLDESMLTSRANVLKKGYIKQFLHKDIIRVFVGLQNAGICLTDLKHEVITGVEGVYDVYVFQTHSVKGARKTNTIRIPRVNADDGSFTVDGVKSHMQLQRMERPIRKISPTKVALTSYYDRKIMVSRSTMLSDNLGIWVIRQVKSKPKSFLTYNQGSDLKRQYTYPRVYSMLGSSFRSITVGEFELNFSIESLLKQHPEFSKYTKKDAFLVGVHKGQPLWVDDYGNLFLGDQLFNTLDGLLGISLEKAPNEFATVNISGYPFPIGVVLCYYFGLEQLLKITKATTRSVMAGTRPKLQSDEYAIRFNDEYLIFSKRERIPTLIFGGMPKLNNISNFSRSDLNDKGVWLPLMGDPKVKAQQFREMKLLLDMFIDPITRDELIRLKYSDSFHYLLIDAVGLLETDFTRHEVELEEQRIVGYERFAGHIHRELVKSTRQLRAKGNDRKHTFDINPDAVIMAIITDTSVNLVEEVNPVHQLKDQEEVTFGGVGGRSEITMVKRSRQQLDSYHGIISEANKDSGKVGFVTYLTSDPKIADYRGNIAIGEKSTLTGLESVTGNLMYGGSHDDAKRKIFTSTQASQAVTAENYSFNSLRTGYENVVAHRTSELYSKVAKEEGKVTAIEEDVVRITYKDGTTDVYPLGLIIGEAAGEYHRHERVTDLKVGDTFKKGDVIGWDNQWFERDPFCPGQVVLKWGQMVRIALVEDQDVFEDALAVDSSLAEASVTPYLKPNRFGVELNKELSMKVKVGDSVDYDTILCEIAEGYLADVDDGETMASDINRLGIKQIRSKHHGKVVSITVTYNGQIEDMSPSMQVFVKAQNKLLKRKAEITGSGSPTGAVSTMLNVNKPMLSPGKGFIVIQIESRDPSTNADKFVIANQMKATVARIMHKPMYTKDGRRVMVKASVKGMFNRMVLGFRNKLAVNEFGWGISQTAAKIYRGTNK